MKRRPLAIAWAEPGRLRRSPWRGRSGTFPEFWCLVLAALVPACARAATSATGDIAVVRHVDRLASASATVPLAGARCRAGVGSCRCRAGDDEETEPPAPGHKRFEIRVSADGGAATLDSASLGRFQGAGPQEACFYIDVPGGSRADLAFVARADRPQNGVSPRLRVAEYGPRGPWWYDIMAVDCVGQQGRCDRKGVDTWVARTVKQRQRGRLEPCGSAVISGLAWEKSGGQAERDGGLYSDLTVRFTMEIKKFATQFAPGSTECVPK
jgi:hypothetical protein